MIWYSSSIPSVNGIGFIMASFGTGETTELVYPRIVPLSIKRR